MKKFLGIMLIVCILQFINTTPAQAAGGCPTPRINHLQSWIMDGSWTGTVPGNEYKMRLTAVVEYIDCPTKHVLNQKLKPKDITWCWTFLSGRKTAWMFKGVRFDAVFATLAPTGLTVVPGWVSLKDNGDDQLCMVQNIPRLSRVWMPMNTGPIWAVNAVIDLRPNINDVAVQFTYNGNTVRALNPTVDPTVGVWY